MQFGQMAFMLISFSANAWASDRTPPTRPCFAIEYVVSIFRFFFFFVRARIQGMGIKVLQGHLCLPRSPVIWYLGVCITATLGYLTTFIFSLTVEVGKRMGLYSPSVGISSKRGYKLKWRSHWQALNLNPYFSIRL